MTAVRAQSHLSISTPRLKVVSSRGRRFQLPVGAAVLVALAFFATVVTAVVLQAMLVSGQAELSDLSAEISSLRVTQAEHRSRVASGESPADLLVSASEIGLVEPAAVVVVPAAPGASSIGLPEPVDGSDVPVIAGPSMGDVAAGRPVESGGTDAHG